MLETGDRLHYLDWGRPTGQRRSAKPLPPLLMLHGLAQTAWSWLPIARRLAAQAHLLAVDLRGHGLSDSPRTGYELESLAFDALTVLTANGYGSDAAGPPAVVAGHGLGAMVAASMAGLRPGSVAGLALVDAGWEEMADATGLDTAEFTRTLGDPPEVLASMAAYLADRREYDPPSWDSDQELAARAAVDEKHAGHVAPVTRAHALRGAVEAMFEFEPASTVGRWPGPLLFAIAGSGATDDERARDRELALGELLARRTADGLPEATIARFPAVGHNLMRYRPADLASALLNLLRDAASYQRS